MKTLLLAAAIMIFGLLAPALSMHYVDGQECNTDSSTNYYYDGDCYTATDYGTGTDACRAAKQGLKDVMVGTTGVTCAHTGCTSTSCHTAVRCLDANCSALIVGLPEQDDVTGLWECTACWGPAWFKVNCTPCVPQ